MHVAELSSRFSPQGQGLDIVELAAVFAVIPLKFGNDPQGKKETWRASVEGALKQYVTQRSAGSLPKAKQRHGAYEGQQPVFSEDVGLYRMDAVSGEDAFGPRRSFKELKRPQIADSEAEARSGTDGDGEGEGGGNYFAANWKPRQQAMAAPTSARTEAAAIGSSSKPSLGFLGEMNMLLARRPPPPSASDN